MAVSRLASQAQINAVLRYAPQRQALAQLVREAHAEHDATVQGAESAGRLTANAVAGAAPRVAGIYDRAQASSSAARQQLGAVLAGLGASGAPQASAAAAEGAQGAEKTARERATAETDLGSQALAAAQAPQFAQSVANAQLGRTLSKLRASAEGISGQEGLATASEIARQEKEARGEALTKRGQDSTRASAKEGHDLTRQGLAQKAKEHQEDLAAKREAGEAGANGKPLTPKEQNDGGATIHEIANFARSLGGTRASRVQALTTGGPSTSVTYKAGEKINGKTLSQNTTVSKKATPEFKPDVLMSAALDLAEYSGHVTEATAHRLQQSGYDIKRLGLPVLNRSQLAAQRVGQVGQQVAQAVTGSF